jgi:hypothetical protein
MVLDGDVGADEADLLGVEQHLAQAGLGRGGEVGHRRVTRG